MRHRTLLPALVTLCLAAAGAGCTRLPSRRDHDRLNRILQSGIEALKAGDYDEAARRFDEGLALSPGNPTFLTDKSLALRMRGGARYNDAIQLADEQARASGKEAARRDIADAAALAAEAVGRLKSAPEAGRDAGAYESNRRAALAAKADALRLLASRFDRSRADEALAATNEYLEAEADGEKRLKARLSAAQMLLDAGRGAEAAEEYRRVLAEDPDNLDATMGAGLGLFQSGDRAKYGEAAAYLRRFVERADTNHPLRASAKSALDFMSQQGVPPGPRGEGARR
ncbi:MAG TPA: hypothetical protein VN282_25885 [Pyrinomonadaceae bacterium]|nr:hypothetical protein [Pyrinomonadaceae bacterium]